MADRKQQLMNRRDGEQRNENDMRTQSGYFTQMNTGERSKFDDKMGQMRQGRDTQEQTWRDNMNNMRDSDDW